MEGINSEMLIEAVETKPAIWDMRHSDYGDKLKRKQAWEDIVTLFVPVTATVEEKKAMEVAVQKRWKNLRDRYARYASKLKKMKPGSVGIRKTPYIYSQHLAFLREVIEHNPTTNSLDISSESEFNDINGDNGSATERRKPGPSSSLKEKRFVKRKRLDPVESKLMSALEANAARQNKTEKDEDDDRYFLLSLLPIMKTIPEHFKLASRMEVMHTLNKYAEFPT